MPTYEYECRKCGHVFEKFHSMTAAPVRKCPKCSGAVRKLFGTGAGIIFKGNGFYQTDYRSENYRKAAESDKPKEPVKEKEKKADSPAKEAPTKPTVAKT